MKVPLSWLRDYVDIPPSSSQRELTDLFNNLGLVVEGVEVILLSTEPFRFRDSHARESRT